MFLIKRPNGFYYICYQLSDGKRSSITTQTKNKAEATKFLKAFSKDLQAQDTQQTPPLNLLKFIDEYLIHSKAMHTYWTTYSNKHTFGLFKKFCRLWQKNCSNFYLSNQ